MVPPEPSAPEVDMVRAGPAGPSLTDRIPPGWRRRGVVLLTFVLGIGVGVVGGVAATGGRDDRPPRGPAPTARPVATGGEVRLLLTGIAAQPRVTPRRGGAVPLRIDGVLLHDRDAGGATVTRIHRPGGSLALRVPALPVGLSVNRSYERVRLRLLPRDCALATEWTPSAQPFTLTWRDDRGDVHTDVGGEHAAATELAMTGYLDRVCGAASPR